MPGRGDREPLAPRRVEREDFVEVAPEEIAAGDLIGANVFDLRNERLSQVIDVVLEERESQYAVTTRRVPVCRICQPQAHPGPRLPLHRGDGWRRGIHQVVPGRGRADRRPRRGVAN
jgi:hypothetical protein